MEPESRSSHPVETEPSARPPSHVPYMSLETWIRKVGTGCWLLWVLAAAGWHSGALEWLFDRMPDGPVFSELVGGVALMFVLGAFVWPAVALEAVGVGTPWIEPSRPVAYGFPFLEDAGFALLYGLPTLLLLAWRRRRRDRGPRPTDATGAELDLAAENHHDR